MSPSLLSMKEYAYCMRRIIQQVKNKQTVNESSPQNNVHNHPRIRSLQTVEFNYRTVKQECDGC